MTGKLGYVPDYSSSMVVSIMNDITSTAKKIMEVFRYFRIKKDEYLSIKLLSSKRHLWRDIGEEQFSKAIEELMGLDYIARIDYPAGWRLRERGSELIKQPEKY